MNVIYFADRDTIEQGYRVRLPQMQSINAEKEGKISFDWANQQYLPYNHANEQGFRIRYPQANVKQQIFRYPAYNIYPIARKEGFSITLPQKQALGYNQGRRVGWAEQQDDGNEQGITIPFSHQQGIRVKIPTGNDQSYLYRRGWPQKMVKQEGFTFSYPQAQSNTADEQRIGISFGWPQKQDATAKKEGITFSYPQKQSSTAEEQRIRIGGSVRWPQNQEVDAKQEGFTFTYPQKKSSTAEKEGITFTYPQRESSTAEKEGITFTHPQKERNAAQAQRIRIGGSFNWPQVIK